MERRCPKCGAVYKDRPAVSRKDGSHICPDCGVREAMEHMGVDREEAEKVVEIVRKHTHDDDYDRWGSAPGSIKIEKD